MSEDLPIGEEDLAALDELEERGLHLLERAGLVMEQLDASARALAEIERRSAAMVEAQQHSPLRRP